ncbi:MAG: magnesium/cobalt transporter CorA [Deltaproteobacteria bacterium]|nr:magnesium/cobalt transporter CorA [Deltaproteobacteria bacterium]
MPLKLKRYSQKSGLPPGSLIHVGERKTDEVSLQIFQFNEGELHEQEFKELKGLPSSTRENYITWVNMNGLHQVDFIKNIGEAYGLHPLLLEDILHTNQRPKIEEFGDYIYVVLSSFKDIGKVLEAEQISLILGNGYVLSFQEKAGDEFDRIRDRIRKNNIKIRKLKADYLFYNLLDSIVDQYFIVLEDLHEKIDQIQQEVLTQPEDTLSQDIHEYRQDIFTFRRAVWPLLQVIERLQKSDSTLIATPTRVYLRDVHDHLLQISDGIETMAEMLTAIIDTYFSFMNRKMNEVIKILTLFTALFMPLTFIVGVYGMNFKNMPELNWPWGYFGIWGIILAVAGGMFIYFRRKKWL